MTKDKDPVESEKEALPEEEVVEEIGGPKHDPIKFGDWQKNGRVSDF
jgi:hypothetical protein